jgi:riboflavin kinase
MYENRVLVGGHVFSPLILSKRGNRGFPLLFFSFLFRMYKRETHTQGLYRIICHLLPPTHNSPLWQLGIPTANIPPDGLDAYPSLATGVYYGVVALDPARFIYDKDESTGQLVSSDDDQKPHPAEDSASATILPAVLSIGYNPFYKNEVKSIVSQTFFPSGDLGFGGGSGLGLMFCPKEIHVMPPLSAPSPTASDASSAGKATTFYKLPDFYSTTLNLLILGYIRPEYDYVSLEALVEDIRVDCEVARKSLERPAYQRYLLEEENNINDEEGEARRERTWLRSF